MEGETSLRKTLESKMPLWKEIMTIPLVSPLKLDAPSALIPIPSDDLLKGLVVLIKVHETTVAQLMKSNMGKS
ncbi:hypothetical protein EUGRSUZ_C03976 [Eucalyptus grandis]|uniref:Uncharacterized protein n=2 Tax=Eucalyptus grandis TaxID=71139 RepID=A0ACC3LLB5_EUCGR|nr:hypothetical protein EUGRSUZ_C03976 [Eucalyptus grandis]